MKHYSKFEKNIDLKSSIKSIKEYAKLSRNSSKKFFYIQIRSRKTTMTLQVGWKIHVVGYMKINTDGIARGCPTPYGDIQR